MSRLSQTKQEIRVAWDAAHYKRYTVKLRLDTDKESAWLASEVCEEIDSYFEDFLNF